MLKVKQKDFYLLKFHLKFHNTAYIRILHNVNHLFLTKSCRLCFFYEKISNIFKSYGIFFITNITNKIRDPHHIL